MRTEIMRRYMCEPIMDWAQICDEMIKKDLHFDKYIT